MRRLLRGQSPFVGGKDHITHHFAYLGFKEKNIVFLLLTTTLISFPIALMLIKNPLAWNFYVSFGMLAYVVALFFVFQYFYRKGEMEHKKKRQEQRPMPKITKESLAAFNEKMQVNN